MSGNESSIPDATIPKGDDGKAPSFTKTSLDTGPLANTFAINGDCGSSKHKKSPSIPIKKCTKSNPLDTHQNQNASAKRVIRKVMVIDPKKLQQAGLDRTLAEAIGRQRLKTLAQEEKKKKQTDDSINLSANESSDNKLETKMTVTSTKPTTSTALATTHMQSLAAETAPRQMTLLKTVPTPAISNKVAAVPVIKKVETVKNTLLKSPGSELPVLPKNNAGFAKSTTSNLTESNSPASVRKIFVTPKITITSPVEASSSLRIIPQHRLENVKYILQCKILKKQQLAAQAHQATQNFQFSGSATSSITPSKVFQMPLVAPKIEKEEEYTNIIKEKPPKQLSPDKTPQDIARVLDFDSEATTTISSSTIAKAENAKEIKRDVANDKSRIKNYRVYTPKASPTKLEESSTSSRDIAQLIARIGHVVQPFDKTHKDLTPSTIIPKATIKCEKLPMEFTKNKKVSVRKERSTKANVTIPKQENVSLPTMKNQIVKVINRAPSEQKHDNVVEKCPIVDPNTKQSTESSQFKDFPLFSPLKQPFPVVTHSQDLPLPTISTFKTPFPTSLIRIGQMTQPQRNSVQLNTITKTSTSSLVVLENKVLTQDEKIDLTGLGLATPNIDTTSGINTKEADPPSQAAPIKATECNEIAQSEVASTSKFNLKFIPSAEGAKVNNRTILSMNKVKLSTEQITALVKAINTNKTNSPKQFVMIRNFKTLQKPNERSEGLVKPNQDNSGNLNMNAYSSKILPETLNTHMTVSSTSQSLNSLYTNTTVAVPKPLEKPKDEISHLPEISVSKLNTCASLNYIPQENPLNQKALAPINYLPHGSSLIQLKNTFIIPPTVASNTLPTKFETQCPQDSSIIQSKTNDIKPTSDDSPPTVASNTLRTKLETQCPQDSSIIQSKTNDIKPSSYVTSTVGPKLEVLSDSGSQSDTEVKFKNPLPRIVQNMPSSDYLGYNKSGAYVIDSGDESDPSISAVDFIASLAAEHPITEDTQLELSPEELNLNASFSMNFSPLRIPNRDRTDSIKSEIYEHETYEAYGVTESKIQTEIYETESASDGVQIGNIITICEENILKGVTASKQMLKLENDNGHTTIKTQEVFQLTNSTEYPERTQQKVQIDNMENINNLDIIKTDGVAESKVGPIIVKNIEIGSMNNIEAPRLGAVIVQNLETRATASSGKLSEGGASFFEDASQDYVKILPIKGESNTNNVNTRFKMEEGDGCVETISTKSKEPIQATESKSNANLETFPSLEINKSITMPCIENNSFCGGLNFEQPSTSAKYVEKLETENNSSATENESILECETSLTTEPGTSKQLSDEENNDTGDKEKPVAEEKTSSSAPKRLPRIKKGKINLVQRRKTPAIVQDAKKVSTKVTEADEAAATQRKQILEANAITQLVVTPNMGKEIVDEAEKKIDKDCIKERSSLIDVLRKENSDVSKQKLEAAENNKSNVEQIICDIPMEARDELTNSACKEPLLESSALKRKTANISELLQPPKKSKRKSFVEDTTSDKACNEATEQETSNILVEAVKAATQETELTPAKNPFKKAKIEVNVAEKPIKGIQNLLTKLNKDKHLYGNKAEVLEYPVEDIAKSTENNKKADTLVKEIDDGKSISESLKISPAELKTTNESLAEQSRKENSTTIIDSKTDQMYNLLEQEAQSKLQIGTTNLNVLVRNEDNETADVSEAKKDCDIVNVIANEQVKEKNIEDNSLKADAQFVQNNEDGEQRNPDFFGFDHSSPSTQNIESNLQHLITITNSAEKTKTREENFSTEERESPHVAKNKGPTKSWLTTEKATSKKSKHAQERRKSMSRRSVPLKKRWEVIPKSEDDIEISDDLTPEGDDEEDCNINNATSQVILLDGNKGGKETEEVVSTVEKEPTNEIVGVKENPAKTVEIIKPIEVINNSTVSQKRNLHTSEDGKDARAQINEIVDVTDDKTNSTDLETPNKSTRMDEKSQNIFASTSKKIKCDRRGSNTKATKSTNSNTKQGNATTNEDVSSSYASVDNVEINEGVTKSPKAKRVRKAELKNECNEATQMQIEEDGTTNSLPIVEHTNKNNEIENTQKLLKEQEIDKKSKVGQKHSKKVEAEGTVELNQPEIEQVKSAKKRGGRGRKPKITIEDYSESANLQQNKETLSIEEKKTPRRKTKECESRSSTSIAEVSVKEEFVTTSTELVVPSLTEIEISLERSKKNTVFSPTQGAETQASESLNHEMESIQKFATSTPTSELSTENKSNGSRKKRKSLSDIVVSLAKNSKTNDKTLNDEESAIVIVRKKRGRKPKSMNTSQPNTTESIVCNGVTKADTTTTVASINDSTDGTTKVSVNPTETTDVSLSANQTIAETPIKIPKKRGRKPKVLTATPDTPAGESATTKNQRNKKVVDLEARGNFNERLLLITNRGQLETDEILTVEPMASTSSKTDIIQCGLCLQEMARETWLDHLATHYGVGWIVGETTAINVTIRNEVLKAMMAFLKVNAGKYPLTCRMCQRTYRSGLGTLLHIEMCGATDNRQQCDYCNQEYSKLSIASHMRICSQKLSNKSVEAEEGENAIKEPILNNIGRRKRESVQKAEKILKAIGSDSKISCVSYKDAKRYVRFVHADGPEKITEKWTSDLESSGNAHCPAPNCTFETQDLGAIQSHYEGCEFKASDSKGVYICKLCADSSNTYESAKNVIIHVLRDHKNVEDAPDFEADVSDCDIKTDDEASDDDDVSSGVNSDEENYEWSIKADGNNDEARRKKRRSKKSGIPNPLYADRKVLYPPRDSNYSRTAMRLWAEFTSEQYSKQPFFTDIKVNFNVCASSDYEQYLPQWESSMKFNVDSNLNVTYIKNNGLFGKARTDIEWSQLQRFEMIAAKNDQLIFIGDAIKILEWVPLPSDIKEQYLLVSTRREYTRTKNPKIGNTLLWLYKAVPASAHQPLSMSLHYAINIPDGPVHCLAFLPSGGYDANANRLGLVAIGTATSTIKVYALPLAVKQEAPIKSQGSNSQDILRNLTTINLEPIWLLALDLSNQDLSSHPLVDTQCKALCWSEFSGHAHIFAGYSNGCISYWDITCEDNLNRFIVDGVPNYVPINFFYTRERNIHAMALHYDTSGVRLLAVVLSRRLLYIYDMQQLDRPLPLKDEITRNEVMDMEWSPVWHPLAVAVGDSFPNNCRTVYAISPTNIVFKNETIEKFNGTVTKIHYNPVQHILANGTDNGDLVLLNTREMHLKDIMHDSIGNRAAAIMDLQCLNGTDIPQFNPKSAPKDWSYYEKNYRDQYGLVFGPLEKMQPSHKSLFINEQRRPPIHLITCTRINSLRCNKNFAGRKLLAVGYENGFLRIFNIDRNSYFH